MANIAFRVDVATHIGTGHWQRCLTLARYLLLKGCQITFFYRNFDEDFDSLFTQKDIRFICIGNSKIAQKSNLAEREWVGVDQELDSEQFIAVLDKNAFDVCIIDHYSLDECWQSKVRPYFKKIVVIDDLANRKHNCDILLDQNYYQAYQYRYDKLIPPSTIKLLGPNYSLLRQEFSILRHQTAALKPNQILVNFGGVGHFILLQKLIEAIHQVPKYDYIVITGNLTDEEFDSLKKRVTSTHIQIMKSTQDMAQLMKESAFALGACGSTVWERFCLGINSALIQMADNQAILLDFLTQQDLIDNLGLVETITTENLIRFLKSLDLASPKLIQRKQKIQQLVDGLGVNKVGDTILESLNA